MIDLEMNTTETSLLEDFILLCQAHPMEASRGHPTTLAYLEQWSRSDLLEAFDQVKEVVNNPVYRRPAVALAKLIEQTLVKFEPAMEAYRLYESVTVTAPVRQAHQDWQGQTGRIVKLQSDGVRVRLQGVGRWWSDRVFDLDFRFDQVSPAPELRADQAGLLSLIKAYERTIELSRQVCTTARVEALEMDAQMVKQILWVRDRQHQGSHTAF